MSESDSDLDFESADEDTSCDVNSKNNNTIQKTLLAEDVNKIDLTATFDSQEVESCASETLKKDSCTDLMSNKSENIDNEQSVKTHDIDNNVNETIPSVENDCRESDFLENNLSSKLEKANIAEDNSTKEIGRSEITENKVQEKQRVPLRLEKKIQQKQHMSKDNSIENDSTAIYSEKSIKRPEQKSSSWGFGNWGTSLLSTAASSVSTFTNQVSHGIGTVLETVENTLGAPPPEELASALNNRKEFEDSSVEKAKDVTETEENFAAKSSLLSDVSSWTKVLENTGSKVLMGGLDTLELIGKKTIDIITEGDPGLRKKRAVFSDGLTLSKILREAKAEADELKQDEDSNGIETVHYSLMFDEYQGLVHLEALEMLSKENEMKLHRLLMRLARNAEIRKNTEEIKCICENIPSLDDPADYRDFKDFDTVCRKYVLELNLTFNLENIIKVQKRITDVLKSYENVTTATSTPQEIYHSAVSSLAEFTAKCIEAFHKVAELILVQPILEPSVEHFATNLTGLTTVMCIEINNLSSRYHQCLRDSISKQYEDGSSEKANITNVAINLYLEAGNSNKYIQDAFLLLVPILQVSLIESSQ